MTACDFMLARVRELRLDIRLMTSRQVKKITERQRRVHWALVFSLLFALLHISSHDIQDVVTGDNGVGCKICRLSHAPADVTAEFAFNPPLFLHAAVIVPRAVSVPSSFSFSPHLARGPPHY